MKCNGMTSFVEFMKRVGEEGTTVTLVCDVLVMGSAAAAKSKRCRKAMLLLQAGQVMGPARATPSVWKPLQELLDKC